MAESYAISADVRPTFTVAETVFVESLITETLLESSFTTNTSLLVGSYTISVGLTPTVTVAETVFVESLMTETLLESSFTNNISAFPES